MQFFTGAKKGAIERALASSWKGDDERDALAAQLRDAGIKPAEAIPLLWHNDPVIRQVGVDLFLARTDLPAVQELLQRLSEQPPHVRAFALRLVGRLPSELATRAVEELIRDRSSTRQRLGWEVALHLTGEVRLRYLERAVEEAPAAYRPTALQRLLQERPAVQMLELLVRLARDSDARLAPIALEAAATIERPEVFDLMLDRFANGDAAARDRATAWLRAAAERDPLPVRRKMLELLSDGEESTRRVCIEILLATGAPDEVLVEILLFCRSLVGWLRQRILETLRTLGDTVLRSALNLLEHPEDEIRTGALVLAENYSDPRIIEPVARLLRDPDWFMRIAACETLGRLQDARCVPHLVGALEDEETRWAAIDALAQTGAEAALRPLAGLLRDPRPEVRGEVVRAFARFSDKRLIPILTQLKEKDPSAEVRTRASEVLRDLQTQLQLEVSAVEPGTHAPTRYALRPLDQLLARVRAEGASDLHLTVDEPPFARKLGQIVRLEDVPAFDAAAVEEAIFGLLDERGRALLRDTGELDFCHAIPEIGRYRVNAFRQRKGWSASFRVIANVPPTFSDLRLPGRLTELLDYHQGIILISGPAGSGKSTTLAALVNLINETKADHVITLEDPIELVHPVKSALVNQREVGRHTTSFARALRAALREDPDVIVVGEMRDAETIRLALTAAETGHLVIGTLQTPSCTGTVDRLIKSFPPDEQPQVRMALSEALKYVVCQSLVPRKDAQGRVAVYEILKGTFSVGSLIRDNKIFQIPNAMSIGRAVGMQTVDQALMDLVEAGLIAPEAAWRRAERPDTFEPLCRPEFLRDQGMTA
jgi:twitching motility protein PilT